MRHLRANFGSLRDQISVAGDQMPSIELETILRTAGWNESRQFDASPWINKLRSRGYTVVRPADDILHEFGALRLIPRGSKDGPNVHRVVVFDPFQDGEMDRVKDWEQRLGFPLTPIGFYDNRSTLYVSTDGAVYMMWDSYLWKAGDSLFDALENTLLFDNRTMDEIMA